ncbi:MAG: AAA family ATPase [Syntrophobacterales bacterium]|jgi:predicted ATPase|nr:AAA family ATPase [Syntrophobacterales bacterium]
MIKRMRIHNFFSLKDLTLDLGLRNVLVGPNMAGKSNIIRALKFLTLISTTGLTEAITKSGGFSEILWKGTDEGKISFSLTGEFLFPNEEKPRTYEYEIALIGSASTASFVLEKETLKRLDETGDYILAEFRSGQGKGFHPDGSVAFEQKERSEKSFLEYSVPGWEGMGAKQVFSRWQFFHLLSPAMREVNVISKQFFLNEHGNNLASWLHTLQTTYPDEFKRLSQVIKDVMPDIIGIFTPPTQMGTTFVQIKEKHLKRSVNIWSISDGALHFLALLSLIFAPEELGAPLFCVEEPETHLHPQLIDSLVEILLQRQQELGVRAAQIVVTTHHPYLIDKLSLEDLIAVYKKDGATKCIRCADKKDLKILLQQGDLSLSDFWYSGALGEE